jgi:hypothetical protein
MQIRPSPRHHDSGFSEAEAESRIDSAVAVSIGTEEALLSAPRHIDEALLYAPRLPPPVTGHGRRLLVHQTIPVWAGSLIVIGVFAWTTVWSWNISKFSGVGGRS